MSLSGAKHMVEQSALGVLRASKLYKVFAPALSGKGCIFMFHRIVKDENRSSILPLQDLEVSPEYLETVINYCLDNNYEIISLDKLYEYLNLNKFPEKRFAVFTFDDGYRDNYTLAYPVFKKYNLPFAIYITNCFPDRKAKIWWYALEKLFAQQDKLSFVFKGMQYEFDFSYKSNIRSIYLQLENLITQVPEEDLDELFDKIFSDNNIDIYSFINVLALTWDEIKKLSEDELVTIGAHTVTHRSLKQLNDKECYDEMYNSKKIISDFIGKEVEHFSYPFGSKNFAGQREFDFAKKIGFKTATTTRKGHIFPKHDKLLTNLPRIQVDERQESIKNFESYFMSGIYPYYKNGFKLIETN